ncbi:MAG: cytochrome c-type biogenesis protein CcmH [Dehalococcoidia bacterium]|nr:cytochrome c-type biogenesis protein CcmH [Dehalococcoidia bacterium]
MTMLTLALIACSGQEPSLEERAYSIDKSLICPVCPGETIDQAQVELASQMREIVRERLAAGWSREQILQFFVDRYGERVLAAPPKKGFNLVAWVVPIAVGVGGVLLLAFVVRAMRRAGQTQQDDGPVSEQELEPYLSLVDQELELSRGSAHEPEKDD